MNKPSDMLYRLASGLSEKEAAHFRRSLSVYDVAKGKNNFLTLFDALRGLSSFEDSLLKKKLPKGFKMSTLSSLKSQLKAKLMDFLVLNHDSNFARIHRKLEEIEILSSRNFHVEAHALALETKKLIYASNLKPYIFTATYFESYTLNYLGGKIFEEIRAIGMENSRVAHELSITYRVASYLSRVFILQGKGNVLRKQEDVEELETLTGLVETELLRPDVTLSHKIHLEQGLTRLYGMTADSDKAFEHAQILHILLSSRYAEYAASDSDRAFSIYGDVLGIAYQAKQVETYKKWFAEFETALNELPASPMFHEFHAVHIYLNCSLSQNKSEREKGWQDLLALYKSGRFANISTKKTTEEILALGCIERKQYEEAAYFLNLLIEPSQSTSFYLEQYDFFRVVRLVMLYEQMTVSKTLSHASFSSQVNTVYQRLRKIPDGYDYKIEKLTVACFKSLSAVATKQEHLNALKDLREYVARLYDTPSVFVKQRALYFDVFAWVEEKLNNG